MSSATNCLALKGLVKALMKGKKKQHNAFVKIFIYQTL